MPIMYKSCFKLLKQYNFKSIKTKEQLIIFLYKFHNNVQRLNKPLYDFKSLDIYKRGKILKISEIMVKQLNKPLRNDNFILGMFKTIAATRAHEFISKNKNNFTLL